MRELRQKIYLDMVEGGGVPDWRIEGLLRLHSRGNKRVRDWWSLPRKLKKRTVAIQPRGAASRRAYGMGDGIFLTQTSLSGMRVMCDPDGGRCGG